MDYEELMNDVFELERKLFIKMDSYYLVEQKCDKKCLNTDERKQLYSDIHYVFTRLIKIIKNSCPGLTDDHVLLFEKIGLGKRHCRPLHWRS